MERWRGRSALVTGASAGLGYAIAEALACHGMHVFGCARRVEEIEKLAEKVAHNSSTGGKITAIKCDLLDEQQILAMFQQIEQSAQGHVDILINNAGKRIISLPAIFPSTDSPCSFNRHWKP